MMAEIITALIAGLISGFTAAGIVAYLALHTIVTILEERNERK